MLRDDVIFYHQRTYQRTRHGHGWAVLLLSVSCVQKILDKSLLYFLPLKGNLFRRDDRTSAFRVDVE